MKILICYKVIRTDLCGVTAAEGDCVMTAPALTADTLKMCREWIDSDVQRASGGVVTPGQGVFGNVTFVSVTRLDD